MLPSKPNGSLKRLVIERPVWFRTTRGGSR
jgi:hypothetical protein